jgi:hypothetical protein
MEAEMERLLKEKEQAKPMEGIPLSAIPIATPTVIVVPSATQYPYQKELQTWPNRWRE